MKQLIVLICLSFALSTYSSSLISDISYTNVYICNSQNGKKYHFTKSCRGLNACKSAIKKMTITEAKEIGKTLCGWED